MRRNGLDLLKIILTILMIFHHYQQAFAGGNEVFYGGYFYYGYLCELFFMISGFLAYRYFEDLHETRRPQWIINKVRGLMIPAAIVPSLLFPLLYLYQRLYGEECVRYFWHPEAVNFSTISKIFMSFLGVDVWLGQVVDPTWFVSVLVICFVFLFAILQIYHLDNNYGVISLCVLLYLAIIIVFSESSVAYYIARGMQPFLLGIVLGLYECNSKIKRMTYFMCTFLMLFIPIVYYYVCQIREYNYFNYQLLVLIYYPIVIISMTNPKIDALTNHRIINYLSNSVLYIYLLNWPLLMLMIIVVRAFTREYSVMNTPLYMILFAVINFLVGILVRNVFMASKVIKIKESLVEYGK